MSWPLTRIGAHVTVRGGGTPRRDHAEYFSGTIPWVTPKDMKTWGVVDSEIKITADAVANSPAKIVPANTVLLVVRSGILKRTVPVAVNRCAVAINQDMKSLECDEKILPDFLARAIKAAEPTILSWVRATTADNYPIENLRELRIPLPPIDDQQRIVSIFDRVEELRAKRVTAKERLDELALTRFREMFADGELAAHARIDDLCTLVRGSSPRPQGDPRYFGGPVPRLMIADISRDGMYVTPAIDSLTEEGARKSRPMPAGSVVMAVSGAVGLPAVLTIDACIHDGFVGFRELDKRLTPAYFYYWLLSQRQNHKARAPGAIWVNLTTDQVRDLVLPLPPLELQQRFSAEMDRLRSLRATQERQLLHIDELSKSLYKELFGDSAAEHTPESVTNVAV